MDAKEKECACRAFALVDRLLDSTMLYLSKPDEASHNMQSTAVELLAMMQEEFKKKRYDGVRRSLEPTFDKMQKAVNLGRYGSAEHRMLAAETVRNELHLSDALKQLLTCGPVLHEQHPNLSKNAGVLKVVFSLCDAADAEDAREPLAAHFQAITCGVLPTK